MNTSLQIISQLQKPVFLLWTLPQDDWLPSVWPTCIFVWLTLFLYLSEIWISIPILVWLSHKNRAMNNRKYLKTWNCLWVNEYIVLQQPLSKVSRLFTVVLSWRCKGSKPNFLPPAKHCGLQEKAHLDTEKWQPLQRKEFPIFVDFPLKLGATLFLNIPWPSETMFGWYRRLQKMRERATLSAEVCLWLSGSNTSFISPQKSGRIFFKKNRTLSI